MLDSGGATREKPSVVIHTVESCLCVRVQYVYTWPSIVSDLPQGAGIACWLERRTRDRRLRVRIQAGTAREFYCPESTLRADWPVLNLVKKGQCKQLLPVCFLTFIQTLYFSRSRDSLLVKCWTRDWKVVSSNPGWSGGKIFLSRVNCTYWLLFGVRSTPFVIAVACKRPWSFCQKCRWQVTPKHAYIVDPMMWE